MRSSDVRRRRWKSRSGPATAPGRFRSELEASARAPVPARKATRPNGAKWETPRVAPRQHILQCRCGTKRGSSRRTRPADCSCGGSTDRGRHVSLQIVLIPSRWIFFRNIGNWAAQPRRKSAPPPFVNRKETAHVRTPRSLSPPDDGLPPTAGPKTDSDDMDGTPATMSLNVEISSPDQICRAVVRNRIV